MISTRDVKLKFLGITPVWEDGTGKLTPQQLVALSGLLTYSGKSIDDILEELRAGGKDIDKKIIAILRKSSLKGHASMATTPAFAFSYEASKFIDSAFTGLVFASAIMASGRRTDTSAEDIVYPEAIAANPQAREIYEKASRKNIEFLNRLLKSGIAKDEASKILQYGIYGTGIIQISVESLATLRREYNAQAEWMPEDVGILLNAIERELKSNGVDLLYASRLVAPRNNYPYPNIFKDPSECNLAREAQDANKAGEDFKIISADFIASAGLEKRLKNLKKEIKEAVEDKDVLKKEWPRLLEERQAIARDYGVCANVKMLSSCAWRVWGDKKRHRTVPMAVDSVYHRARAAVRALAELENEIESGELSHKAIDAIDRVFSMPPGICRDRGLLTEYARRALDSLRAYDELVKMGIKEKDAIFVVPRGLKLSMVQDYNLYNLIAGYYPLRVCATAEEELRRLSIKEAMAIKGVLQERGMEWLSWHIQPKCYCAGFCLEEQTCGMVKNLTKDYDDDFHKEMHADLEEKFRAVLENIQ